MMNRNFAWERVRMSVIATAIALGAPTAMAQDHAHGSTSPAAALSADQQRRAGVLVAQVRQATERFKDVHVAESEGYGLAFGCVSGSGDEVAMGLHFVNGVLVAGGVLRV